MNKMIIMGFASSFFITSSLFRSNFPELSKLPKESKIRMVCEQTPGNWWFMRNATENACAVLNDEFYNSFEKAKQLEKAITKRDIGQLIRLSRARNLLSKDEVHEKIDMLLPEASHMEKIHEHTMITVVPYVMVEMAARNAAETQQ